MAVEWGESGGEVEAEKYEVITAEQEEVPTLAKPARMGHSPPDGLLLGSAIIK